MLSAPFFYRLYRTSGGKPVAYLGTAFPVKPNGGLLTCRHVVDITLENGEAVCVLDNERETLVSVETVQYPIEPSLDLAFLPEGLRRAKPEYFPVLDPTQIFVGEDVYSFGSFVVSGETQEGYFKGNIVNFGRSTPGGHAVLTLSYPVVEGLSGSPVLTYHNGPKVVGLAYGSRSSRVTAAEVLDYDDGNVRVRETVNRIVEFGVAYHAATLVAAADDLGFDLHVSSEALDIPGLE
jgi:hypothetical protein